MKVAIALALAVGLSACQSLTPEKLTPMIGALKDAGCSGSARIDIGAGTAAGVSPGYANGSFHWDGTCDPSKVIAGPAGPALAAALSTPQ